MRLIHNAQIDLPDAVAFQEAKAIKAALEAAHQELEALTSSAAQANLTAEVAPAATTDAQTQTEQVVPSSACSSSPEQSVLNPAATTFVSTGATLSRSTSSRTANELNPAATAFVPAVDFRRHTSTWPPSELGLRAVLACSHYNATRADVLFTCRQHLG